MFISPSRTQPCPSLHLNGVQLERVTHYKYLGIWISDNFSWEKHIDYICIVKLVAMHLGYLFRTFSPHCTPQDLIYLYRVQVLPILNYGCIVWDPHLNKHKLMLEEFSFLPPAWFLRNGTASLRL